MGTQPIHLNATPTHCSTPFYCDSDYMAYIHSQCQTVDLKYNSLYNILVTTVSRSNKISEKE